MPRDAAPAHRLWYAPDRSLTDMGRAGELLVAQVRLGLAVIIALVPLVSYLRPEGNVADLIAVMGTAFLVMIAATVLLVVRAGYMRPWLPFATSLFDVSIISAIAVGFILIDRGDIAANSRVTYPAYFLALLATCLRFDIRVCTVAGLTAIVQYTLIVAGAVANWPEVSVESLQYNGVLDVGEQVGRIVLLVAGTLMTIGIVDRGREMRLLSTHDSLTGLYNRSYFDERVAEELLRARRYGRPLTLAMIDLDFFKSINDKYGHAAGDAALRLFARILKDSLRRTDIIGRYGGEEFAVAFPETDPLETEHKLDQVRAAVESTPLRIEGRNIKITFSAGVVHFPDDGDDVPTLARCGDDLLLRAKREGRNRVIGSARRT
jgi:diguanylate cyclase (GGDEF)-like protein